MEKKQLSKRGIVAAVSYLEAIPKFSKREETIVRMMADGMTNKEIANSLVISPETVKTQVSRLLKKLKAKNRTEAVASALRFGLLSLKPVSAPHPMQMNHENINVSYEMASKEQDTYMAPFPAKPRVIR